MSQNSSKTDNSYSLSLNEVIQSFKEEGLDFDAPIRFYVGPGKRVYLASIYPDKQGQPIIDIESE